MWFTHKTSNDLSKYEQKAVNSSNYNTDYITFTWYAVVIIIKIAKKPVFHLLILLAPHFIKIFI